MKRSFLLAPVVLVLALFAAACSSTDEPSTDSSNGGSSTAPVETTAACTQEPTVDDLQVEEVDGVPADRVVRSFDGTAIRIHWFPLPDQSEADQSEPVPTVMVGPGWGQPGATDDGVDVLGLSSSPIDGLHEAGYNVLTWDPRGFGESEGEANVNFADLEGRDVQVLIDWLATQPEVALDRDGDPRLGMLGGSYGGGIQLVTAALDCRVDAIVPVIAWHSLVTSLFPNETVKSGWSGALMEGVDAFDGTTAPEVTAAAEEGFGVGTLDDSLVEWFDARGPADLVSRITAPTLIIHATTDTLFTPSEAMANYAALVGTDTPVAMMWGCGGHGVCLTPGQDPELIDARSIAWLDRWLCDDDTVDTGPTIDLLDQEGVRWFGEEFPLSPDGTVTASGAGGTLALSEASAAGPIEAVKDGNVLASFVTDFTPGKADEAIELTLTAEDDALVVGRPTVRLVYRGTTPDGPEPTRAFLQLVDDTTGLVLGNQITPVQLVLDGSEQVAEVALEGVVQHLRAGSSVTLQIVATTPAFTTPRLGGELVVTEVDLVLPTTELLTPQ